MTVTDRILAIADRRPPDFIVGRPNNPYLLRWFVIPRNPVFNMYLHCFMRSDDDRAHHDHPWLFNISWHLRNGYIEVTIRAGGLEVRTRRDAGAWKLRLGRAPHRVELLQDDQGREIPCWTLFITGPRVREWGFYCMARGWVHWKKFTAAGRPGEIGKGCDG